MNDIQNAAEMLRRRVVGDTDELSPSVGIILGSGLGAVGQLAIESGGIAVDFADIPGMPRTAVAGHAGRLIIGRGHFANVVLLQGRVHYYEGHSLSAITFAVRLLAELGIHNLIVTNAAGGIDRAFAPGDLMLIDGHWTFLDIQNSSQTEPTFGPQPTGLWNRDLRELAAGVETKLNVHSGTYAMMSGPNYETPAEIRMLANFGVSAVGMSTIPEAVEACRRGMKVLGISCITNVASGLSDAPLDHSEVSATAGSIEHEFSQWVCEVIERIRQQESN